jgi:hypothetical protein
MAANNNSNNTFEQVYNVREDDTLSSKVALIIVVVVQRGLMLAGFSINKELLTIHYKGYNKNKQVWDLDFFEYLLSQEPLLTVREKVKGIFIASDKTLIVPDALYDEKEAKNWLRHIHHVDIKETIESHPLENDKARYLHAVPVKIMELLKINFKKVPALPLAVYQFRNARQQSLFLQCCITGEQVCATLHNYSQLLWHRIFDYSCAEDIAYMIKHLCAENNISPSKISLSCNTLTAAEYHSLNELSQYFPIIKSGNGRTLTGSWDAPVSLAHQLLECV